MPYPSMPCGRATPETALQPRVAHPQGGRPAAVFYPLGHPTPMAGNVLPAHPVAPNSLQLPLPLPRAACPLPLPIGEDLYRNLEVISLTLSFYF
jgi:hypothetical protein